MKKLGTALLCAFLGTGLAIAADSKQVVELDLNGDISSLSLTDFSDGESQSFQSGEHTVVVTRIGDQLTVKHDGVQVDAQEGLWIQEDGQTFDLDSEEGKQIFIHTEDGNGQAVNVEVFSGEDLDIDTLLGGSEAKQIRIQKKIVQECEGECSEEVHVMKIVVKKSDEE